MTAAARAGGAAPGRVTTRPGGGDLLTPREVAGMYRVSVKTLRNWRYLDKGPAFVKVGGGTVRYRRDAVNAHVA